MAGNSALGSGQVAAAGPFAVPREGEFAALDPNLADFKEVNYIGHQAERQRYTDPTDFTYDFPRQAGLQLHASCEALVQGLCCYLHT